MGVVANQLAKKQQSLQKEETGIIVSTYSVENYIRRAVHRIGWQETNTSKFHIKFDVADIDVKLKPH